MFECMVSEIDNALHCGKRYLHRLAVGVATSSADNLAMRSVKTPAPWPAPGIVRVSPPSSGGVVKQIVRQHPQT
jgi:hypothetical protein